MIHKPHTVSFPQPLGGRCTCHPRHRRAWRGPHSRGRSPCAAAARASRTCDPCPMPCLTACAGSPSRALHASLESPQVPVLRDANHANVHHRENTVPSGWHQSSPGIMDSRNTRPIVLFANQLGAALAVHPRSCSPGCQEGNHINQFEKRRARSDRFDAARALLPRRCFSREGNHGDCRQKQASQGPTRLSKGGRSRSLSRSLWWPSGSLSALSLSCSLPFLRFSSLCSLPPASRSLWACLLSLACSTFHSIFSRLSRRLLWPLSSALQNAMAVTTRPITAEFLDVEDGKVSSPLPEQQNCVSNSPHLRSHVSAHK